MTAPPDPFAVHRAAVAAAGGFVVSRPNHVLSWLPGRGERLVVSFDNLAARREEHRMPWGLSFLQAQGWDVLGVMCRTADWFRHPALWSALEGLRDEGFFARFPAVSMYGSSMGGFGALAFAPIAPGCTVLAFAPQSTLDPGLAPFETRYAQARARTDWTGPWADAAIGAQAAGRVYLAFDPAEPQDARHAARIAGPKTTLLAMPHLGHKLPPALLKMRLLKPLSVAALTGTLTTAEFARMFRARRQTTLWQAGLLARARAGGHSALALPVAEKLMAQTPHWRLRHEINALRATLGLSDGGSAG